MRPSEPSAPAADRWSTAPFGGGTDAAPGPVARPSGGEEPRARSFSTGRSTAAKMSSTPEASSSRRLGQPRRRSLDDVAAAKKAAAELHALALEPRSGSSGRHMLLRGTSSSSLHLSSRQLSASGSSRRMLASAGSLPRRDAASEPSFAGASAASLPRRDAASEQSFGGTPRTPLDRRALYRLAGEQRARTEGSSNEIFPLELLPLGLISSSTRLIEQTGTVAEPSKEGDAFSSENANAAAEKLATLALTKRRDNVAAVSGDTNAHAVVSGGTDTSQPSMASAGSTNATKSKTIKTSASAAAAANRRRRRRGGSISARFQGSSSTSMTLNMEDEESSNFLSSSHLLSKSSITLDPAAAGEKRLEHRQVSRLHSSQRSMVIEEATAPEPSPRTSNRRSHKINLRPFSLGGRSSRSSKPGSRQQTNCKKRISSVTVKSIADSKEPTNNSNTEHNTESEDYTEVGLDNTPDPRLRRRPSSRRLAVDGGPGKEESAVTSGGSRLQRQASVRKEPQDRLVRNPRLRRRPQSARSLVPAAENRMDPSDGPGIHLLDRSVSGSSSELSKEQDHEALEPTSVPHDVIISLPHLTPAEPEPVEHDKSISVRSRLRLAIKRGMGIFPVRNPAVKLRDAPEELSDEELLDLAGDIIAANDALVAAN